MPMGRRELCPRRSTDSDGFVVAKTRVVEPCTLNLLLPITDRDNSVAEFVIVEARLAVPIDGLAVNSFDRLPGCVFRGKNDHLQFPKFTIQWMHRDQAIRCFA